MQRLNFIKASSRPYEHLGMLSHYFHDCGLPDGLVELVWLRASQLNGCAFCIDMHVTDGLKVGIEPRRLHLLSAWRETELYSPAERAALAWTEAVTNVQDGHVPDAVFDALRAHYDEKQMTDLTFAIATINAWNRVAISFRSPLPKTPQGVR
ncbi:carboxymuconolactone decarboxylase family protein [Pandoraea apista]|uniref:Alkylhydroperoxidase n=1 Tax=Pandoraea apista TaxID=93218 RepID=A0A0G4JAS9_9BURK|nr:carboxymuconolactone decarboxylase family protein [Pandoraea apista]ALS67263.1 alkylhydroperoxidase [Pandoraea apista]AVF42015.1 carboxymuconolactone decarboxylase family protein [Pandoraea apista]OXS88910.1 carboxymuconolactone decarboxylase family protein [Pandoraea apista]PTE01853.1 carboxymuconolactone decarboxylase family protein [Pandoraea apista]RRJ34122.1 carboxymuconolactone decarboxylase family protein [Pandoraea apista]